jgi:hypothetical protein
VSGKTPAGLSDAAAALLAKVRKHYLNSGDFNGLFVHGADVDRQAVAQLLRAGLVEMITADDYMNPHIRPWPNGRTSEEQAISAENWDYQYGYCLYPTSAGMKGVRLPGRFKERPYETAMARGRGTLELAYFQTDVLEPYRNDGRYSFRFADFSADMSIGDDAYTDGEEPERDKVSLPHIGFAYDLSHYDRADPESPIVRRVAVFLGDLAKLTPEHQQRWKTYEVPPDGLSPHPVWWASQMGHWPDGIGPFDRVFASLVEINELTLTAFGAELYRSVTRPDSLGWMMRPSQRDWDEFALELFKVIGDNLQVGFFDKVGVPKVDEKGNQLGTLSRLERFLEAHGCTREKVREAFTPFHQVRKARQKPAHSHRGNITDKTFIHRQVALLWDVNQSLLDIRDFLASHPANKGWTSSHEGSHDYRM